MFRCQYEEFKSIKNNYLAPKKVSNLLNTLAYVRTSVLTVFELPQKEIENLAWLVMNGCKLIYLLGDALIWHR